MKTNTKKQTETAKEESYVLSNDEHYEVQKTLFEIESMARLVGQSSGENITPTQDDMADIFNVMEIVGEKIKVALRLLDDAKAA